MPLRSSWRWGSTGQKKKKKKKKRPHIPYVYPKEFEFQGAVEFPPKDYYMPKDLPPMAPHDWTSEGMRYGDLR